MLGIIVLKPDRSSNAIDRGQSPGQVPIGEWYHAARPSRDALIFSLVPSGSSRKPPYLEAPAKRGLSSNRLTGREDNGYDRGCTDREYL